MNCAEADRLFDAYLDGQLTGSLRLELDAHRLRCTRCQQTLAMMQACQHVVAHDSRTPALSESFTERVMTEIAAAHVSPRRVLRVNRRLLAAGGLLSAAAVLLAALLLRPAQHVASVPPVVATSVQPPRLDLESMDQTDLYEYIVTGVERLEKIKANLANDITALPRYAIGLTLPEDLAQMHVVDPLTGLFQALLRTEADDGETLLPGPDQHAL